MLRRKPTALTISPEDINAFEEAHTTHKAFRKYQKTGYDPTGQFRRQQQQQQQENQNRRLQHSNSNSTPNTGLHHYHSQQQHRQPNDTRYPDHLGSLDTTTNPNPNPNPIDPNDELKPLPGDKARIVRSREERIMGVGNVATTGVSTVNNNNNNNGAVVGNSRREGGI